MDSIENASCKALSPLRQALPLLLCNIYQFGLAILLYEINFLFIQKNTSFKTPLNFKQPVNYGDTLNTEDYLMEILLQVRECEIILIYVVNLMN